MKEDLRNKEPPKKEKGLSEDLLTLIIHLVDFFIEKRKSRSTRERFYWFHGIGLVISLAIDVRARGSSSMRFSLP